MRWVWLSIVLLLTGCASENDYQSLRLLPLDQIKPVPRKDAKPRLGLALGGGGVRGFMHLGVLRALDEAGIRAEIVTGTSAGSAAAALYASGMPYDEIEQKVLAVGEMELLDPVFSLRGALNGPRFAKWIRSATSGRPMRDFPVTLGIAVTDLHEGEALLVVDGDVGEAVQASASVPGPVIPVRTKETLLVDGGVLALVPVRFARALGADVVLAIDIFCGDSAKPKDHALDTMLRTFRLQSCKLNEKEASEADILLRPKLATDNPIRFTQRDEAIRIGYEQTKVVIPKLRKMLAEAGLNPVRP